VQNIVYKMKPLEGDAEAGALQAQPQPKTEKVLNRSFEEAKSEMSESSTISQPDSSQRRQLNRRKSAFYGENPVYKRHQAG
jgi:hypothetical protein